jgi:pimeloyl-ACP methyl ester carboxylesterase
MFRQISGAMTAAFILGAMGACASKRMIPPDVDTVEMIFGASSEFQATDGRLRFYEYFCAINEDHGAELGDFRPCYDALRLPVQEQQPTKSTISLGIPRNRLRIFVVLGFGTDCVVPLIGAAKTLPDQARRLGQETSFVAVEGLASTARNARIIRDTVLSETSNDEDSRVVLIGYSKGAVDALDAIVTYPELASRVSAIVSVAGAIGGSALADDVSQSTANLLASIPGSGCTKSDEGAVEDMLPAVRDAWLENHPLPGTIRYYSIVTLPDPEHVSAVLKPSYDKLGKTDYRNDSQVLFVDQIIPRSTILAFLNADHWAIAIPIGRTHSILGSTLINHNDYPREVLMEALILYLAEDLP